MESPPDASTLTCSSCGTAYALAQVVPGRVYRCSRCDVRVAGARGGSLDTPSATGSGPVYLYARAPREVEAPDETMPPSIGRYRLRQVLGRGGMGIVYRAWDPDLSREVALKVLLAGEYSSASEVQRFLREARAAAQLDHTHVVRVLDIGRDSLRAFFTMDLVEGPSVREVLDTVGSVPPREAARIVAVVARALHEAHLRGMVHRDVKPGNVLLQVDGTPLLADFGLVSEVQDGTRITRSGQLMGTPAYMAPEQAEGSVAEPDARSDQYGLGAVLYELLTGRAPYEGERAMEVLLRLMSEDPDPVRSLRPTVPRDLAVIVEKAMARDPSRRYADTSDLADDLDRWQRGEPIQARPPSAAYRARMALQRRWRPMAVGVLLVLALAGGGLAWSTWSELRAGWQAEEREARAAARLERVVSRVDALRLAGRPTEAEQVVEEFLAAPEHRGTRALVQARIRQGREATEAGAVDEALAAWAAAYGTAHHPDDQRTALRGLGALFVEHWRFAELDVLLDTLEARHPEATTDPTLRAWRARARMALGDPAGAAAALPAGPARDLLAGLTHATRVPQLHGERVELELDGTPGPEWLVKGADGVRGVDGDASFSDLGPWEVPGGWGSQMHVFGRQDGPGVGVLAHHGGAEPELRVLEVGEGALIEAHRWPEARVGAALSADLDGDGRDALYVGVGPYARYLLRLDPDTWAHDRPQPAIDAARSDVAGLAAGDYDGDGRDELAVAVGPWSAFDLRVLEGSDDAPLTQVDRRQLGYVNQVLTLPGVDGGPERLLAVKSDRYPSRILFPEGRHVGRASGVYVFGLEGGQLVEQGFVPSPVPDGPGRSMLSYVSDADLDGDGLVDIVTFLDTTRVDRGMMVLLGTADGGFAPPVFLGGVAPIAQLQLDDDAAMELVVQYVDGARRDETWVLGWGDDRLPGLEGLDPPEGAVPEGLDPTWAATWTRAEDLVQMGLVREGAEQLVALARWMPERGAGLQARYRAGELFEAIGADDEAAALYGEAAELGPLRRPALLGAVRVLERAHRFREALAVIDTLPDDAEVTALRTRLEPLVRHARRLELSFAEGLPDELAVRDPVALRWMPAEQGLRADVLATGSPALEVPFDWSGHRLRLEVELDVQRVEWAGGLRLRLAGPDGVGFGVEARGWGGGDLLEREITCVAPDGLEVGAARQPSEVAVVEAVRVVVDVAADTGWVRCEVTRGADDEVRYVDRRRFEGPVPEGRWALVVDAAVHAGLAMPMAATAVLRSVALEGAGLSWVEPDDVEPAFRHVVVDRADLAWPTWPQTTPRARVQRAAAAAEAGAWSEAATDLAAGLAARDAEAEREVVHQLRVRPSTFAPLLQEAVPPEAFYAWFHAAWSPVLQAHHSDPHVQRVMTTHLGGLERVVRAGRGQAEERLAAVGLLLARGRAWADLGSPAAARRDLRTGLEAAAAIAEAVADPRRGLKLDHVHLELAELEAEAGRPDRALAEVRRALALAPEPQIALDMVDARPALRALRGLPGWAELGP